MILNFNSKILSFNSRIIDYPVAASTPSGSLVTTATLNNATIVAQSPFTGASSGNSYYVTGSTTSYLSVSGQVGYAFGTGDYTIEWFQYETDSNSFPRLFWYGSTPSLGISLEGSYYLWVGASATSMGSKGSITNAWHHFALVRISGRIYFYKNGTLVSTAGGIVNTSNIVDSGSTFYIGTKAGSGLSSEQFGGYITNFRIVKGLGVYTGNFTRPTGVLTSVASANPYGGSNTAQIPSGYVKLLLTP